MCFALCRLFFFFKQKTAYEMRISDWSSDVCSSDLDRMAEQGATVEWPDPRPEYKTLLDYVGETERKPPRPAWRGTGIINLLVYFGWLTLFFMREARCFIAFIGQVLETMVIEVRYHGRLRYPSMVYHREENGLRALRIVWLRSLLRCGRAAWW